MHDGPVDDMILDQAIAWHIRAPEMVASDWESFVVWLEADTRHADIYDQVSMDDRLRHPAMAATAITAEGEAAATAAGAKTATAKTVTAAANDAAPRVPIAANDDTPLPATGRRWWMAGGMGIAAAVAALLVVPMMPVAPDRYDMTTGPGATRVVTLADGTRVEMSGGTRLRLDRHDPRFASLESGEALFHVHHDADHPFTLRSGDWSVRDVGTIFDATRAPNRFDVKVAEGAVLFAPDAQALMLTPGHAVSVATGTAPVLSTVAVDTVGEWRRGRLTLTNEPLSTAVASIARLDGAQVTLAPALSRQRFTGMVRLTGRPTRDIPHFAALTGTSWARDGATWVLSPAATPAD